MKPDVAMRGREVTGGDRVRVLPNRNSIGLGALVLAMWYAGASQSNGAAYLLCFTVIGVAMVSAIHAWANLRGLSVTAGPIRSVFAGEEMRVPLVVRGSARRGHADVCVRARGGRLVRVVKVSSRGSGPGLRWIPRSGRLVAVGEVSPGEAQSAESVVKTESRGCFTEVEVELTSLFPLGFFTASRRIAVRQVHWVYPKPDGRLPLPRSPAGLERHSGRRVEGEDFAGVRPYRRGESQRHIDWKAVARGQPMLVKQWAGQVGETVHLDWHHLAVLETEARLGQLARWVILAERSGAKYSLRLPSSALVASNGEAHMHECLRALATFSA